MPKHWILGGKADDKEDLSIHILKGTTRLSLGGPVVEICLPLQGVLGQPLIRELRAHMPCGQKNQNIKQKQYYNKLSKDFLKNGPHQKKKSIKKCIRKNKENYQHKVDLSLGIP